MRRLSNLRRQPIPPRSAFSPPSHPRTDQLFLNPSVLQGHPRSNTLPSQRICTFQLHLGHQPHLDPPCPRHRPPGIRRAPHPVVRGQGHPQAHPAPWRPQDRYHPSQRRLTGTALLPAGASDTRGSKEQAGRWGPDASRCALSALLLAVQRSAGLRASPVLVLTLHLLPNELALRSAACTPAPPPRHPHPRAHIPLQLGAASPPLYPRFCRVESRPCSRRCASTRACCAPPTTPTPIL